VKPEKGKRGLRRESLFSNTLPGTNSPLHASEPCLSDGIAATRNVELRGVAHIGSPFLPNLGGEVNLWNRGSPLGQNSYHAGLIIVSPHGTSMCDRILMVS